MRQRSETFTRFRRRLSVGYVALCAMVITLLCWNLASGYLKDKQSCEMLAQNSAYSIAARVQELVDAVDQPLQNFAKSVSHAGRETFSPELIQALLSASARDSDSRDWLFFVDADGRGVAATNNVPVRGVSFADHDYFSSVRNSPGTTRYMGFPTRARIFGRGVFFVGRKVETRDGKFLGAVVAAVDAARIAQVLGRARLNDAMSITLEARDRKIFARAPLFAETFAMDASRFAASPSRESTIAFPVFAPLPGQKRFSARAAVGGLPLMVSVSLTQDAWPSRIWFDLVTGIVSAAVALLLGLLSVRFAVRQFERAHVVESEQRKMIGKLGDALEALASSERRLRNIADSIVARVAYINADERYTFHNCGALGAPGGALQGKTLREVHGEALYEQIEPEVRKVLAGERMSGEHYEASRGEKRWFKHYLVPDRMPNGQVLGFYATIIDITDFKTIQQRLTDIARVDTLTGLPNRAALLDRMEQALVRVRRTGECVACLYLDIDRFKKINDSLGHAGGDAALVEFGRRLRLCVRETDIVARLSGDEFVIILEGIKHASEAEQVAGKIMEAMHDPFEIENGFHQISTSIGVVVTSQYADEPRTILRAADEALYQAKRSGRNSVAVRSTVNPPAGETGSTLAIHEFAANPEFAPSNVEHAKL